jgi:lysophospholipase L1-like esterase
MAWGGTLAVGLFVAFGLLLVLEWWARSRVRNGLYYANYPGMHASWAPNVEKHPYLEKYTVLRTNDMGERGLVPYPDSHRVFRVLVAGGSAAESRLLNWERSWPGALEAKLKRMDRLGELGFETAYVGNIGRSGAGNAETMTRILEKILPQYDDLDAVVLMLGASDIVTWLQIGGPADKPAPDPGNTVGFATHPEVPLGPHPRNWGLAELYRRKRARRRRHRKAAAGMWMDRARALRARSKPFIDEVPDTTTVLSHMEKHFRRCIHAAKQYGHAVVVARQPWLEKDSFTPEEEALFWNFCIGTAYNEKATGFFSDRVINILMRSVDDMVKRVCEEEGTRDVDLQGLVGSDSVYFHDRIHFTKEAGPVFADVLSEALFEEWEQLHRK